MACKIHRNSEECREVMAKTRRPFQEEDLGCPLLAMKTMIISLRRKRGNLYPRFRTHVEANWDYITDNVNTRWLTSVCDTIADYGEEEAPLAMLASLMCVWEKLAWSARIEDKHRHSLWDGMLTLSTSNRADAHRNLFRRLFKLTGRSSLEKKLFREVVSRLVRVEDSTLGLLHKKGNRNVPLDVIRISRQIK